ncbi:MAG: DEAD/DEAH box helicase [Acidimicrobiales bacterium]
MTAVELAVALRREKTVGTNPWAERTIGLALYQNSDRFVPDGTHPRRWRLVGAVSGTDLGLARGAATLAPDLPNLPNLPDLYAWQIEALEAWRSAGHRGVIEAVTGAGKTMVGLAAALEELGRGGQVLVVVPTVELMAQWRHRVAALLPTGYSVGCLGDGAAGSLGENDVVVGVVNTLRAIDARPIRRGNLLVADECHRYGSAVNRLALDRRFLRRLGLSATYAREDGGHETWLLPYFGAICYRLGYRRAVDDGVTARFSVALIGVELLADERYAYEQLTESIRARYAKLVARFGLPPEPFGLFLRSVIALASHDDDGLGGAGEARAYLTKLRERRLLLAEAVAKMDTLGELAPAFRAAERSIVFTRSIDAAERVASVSSAHGLRSAAIHSGMTPGDRRAVLGCFADGSLDVIAAPQVLDEGVDVPEADLAVIVAASRSRRQMVQRMGRVLRVKPDGRRARFAVLFAEDTVEDPDFGAQEAFLEEIIPVADEVRHFRSDGNWSLREVVGFLST